MEKEKYLKFAEDFLASFLGKFGLIHHHLSSYNSAISELIPNYLYNLKHEIKDTEGNVKSTICFTNLRFKPPEHNEDNTPILVFPRFAERNNMNYTSEMIVDIIIRESGKETVHENFELGHMPIMVKSCLCPTSRADSETMYAMKEDPNEIGGHFIYNGNPKFVLPIFHIGMNRLDVFPFRSNPQMSYHVEVRSSENILHNTTCVIGIDSKGCIVSTLPFFTFTIPIIAVLLSFGLENDEQIVETIFSEEEIKKLNIKPLVKSLEYSYEMTTKEQAYKYIGTQIKKSAKKEVEEVEDEEDSSEIKIEAKEVDFEAIGKKFMQNEYLPHVGRNDGSDMVKLYTVLWILRKIIIAYNDGKTVDRDHMKDKRTTSIGQLITTQFISGMRRMLSDSSKECLRKMTKKENYDVMRTLHNNHINRAMTGAISTSNWARGGKGKVGITQLQERFVNLQVLCRLRKFKHFLPAGTRVLGPRKKHMSSINIMCSAETPEGPDIGLIQSMSMLATTTMGVDTYVMGAFMKNNFDICPVNKKDTIYDTILIIVNGRIIGTISKKYYKIFVEEFREKRRNGTIPYEVSIETKENYIEIHSDDERFISCYLIVKEGNLPIMKHKELPKFDTLLNTDCVEFLDKYEEESCVICPSLEDFEGMEIEERAKYTHCVVHPSLIDGLGANMIPYRNRNQAPRNIFQCNMGNQTMGIIKLNAMHLSGQPTTIIGYPQKPLVSTFVQRALGLDEMPAGQCVKVAIAPYMQINVEDSQVMSKKFVDMGGGMHLRYWTVSMVCYTNEVFKKPGDNCKKDVSINYSKLGDDGIVMRQMTVGNNGKEYNVNTKLVNGDAIVCKVKHIPGKNPPYVAEVIKYTEMETGYIQDINVFKDSTGSTVVKITLVKVHFPEAGDKWAMRNAQKGVIGEIVPVEDLPFFIDGTTPDIIFSPNGIVSRMTISLLIEMVSGKIVAIQSELHKLKVKDLYDLVCKKKWKTTPKWLETMDYEKIGKKLEEKPEFTEATVKYIQDSNIPPESKLKYYADATAFETEDDILGRLGEELKKYGFSEFGGEMMTDGRTGEMMPCLIMTGLMTYQPLKHLVGRKVQARGDEQGKRQRLNRQPVEGRQKGGGGRHGVMERDSCGAQGVSAIQFSKLVEQSDEYITTICTVCGLLCHDNTCKSCGNSKVEIIRIPYATKTVNQMLQSMNATFGLCKNPEN